VALPTAAGVERSGDEAHEGPAHIRHRHQALVDQRREVFELGRKILVHPYAAAIARGSAAVKSHINGSNDARARDHRGMRECRARLP